MLSYIGHSHGKSFGLLRSLSTKIPISNYIYPVKPVGNKNTHEYRVQFHRTPATASSASSSESISPWHDIPLHVTNNQQNPLSINERKVFNFICEIPAFTKAKMEICNSEPFNPIKQDMTKSNTLRDYHGPIYWNYGCLPQTWEDPTVLNTACNNTYGDNDPIDVVEIGSKVLSCGSITPVIALGCLALIDCNELDYKCICVNIQDELVTKHGVTNIEDLNRVAPHMVNG